MRTFEVPASRTAMVATRTPEHEALFGEEGAVLVSTPDEAREAVRELVADDERRARIARVGRERVEPHTYTARMREILAPWSRVA
jgi:spore maturation protein CgeB